MLLKDYLKENDVVPTIYALAAFGRGINRREVELAITQAGYPLPTKNVLFYLVDEDKKAYLVRYFADIDKYGTEKLKMV